ISVPTLDLSSSISAITRKTSIPKEAGRPLGSGNDRKEAVGKIGYAADLGVFRQTDFHRIGYQGNPSAGGTQRVGNRKAPSAILARIDGIAGQPRHGQCPGTAFAEQDDFEQPFGIVGSA